MASLMPEAGQRMLQETLLGKPKREREHADYGLLGRQSTPRYSGLRCKKRMPPCDRVHYPDQAAAYFPFPIPFAIPRLSLDTSILMVVVGSRNENA